MANREGLIAAALTLFSARGYEAVGVQEIVVSAGVTKPTLYHFFSSKLGLLEALVAQYALPLDEAVASACAAYQRDLAAVLEQLAAVYFDFVAAQPLYYRFELASAFAAKASDPHRLAHVHHARRLAAIEQLFRAASADHGNIRGRERRYAVSLVGHFNSYIALGLDDEWVISDRARHDMLHQFSHGIYS